MIADIVGVNDQSVALDKRRVNLEPELEGVRKDGLVQAKLGREFGVPEALVLVLDDDDAGDKRRFFSGLHDEVIVLFERVLLKVVSNEVHLIDSDSGKILNQ